MEVKAHLNHLRISSRKVRLVVDLIREMEVEEAKIQLKFINKKSSELLLKLLNSAIANAKNNFNLDENNLHISKIIVNDGKILKRWRPRAMGRSARISKRTSNVTITLDEAKNRIK
ncbi:50S ribosomal protein L22 [Candidatus Parcubacteria bacterium]|nr:50S ribosomal protein L22 [Candidatus Parcubacteria bacterium]